MLLGNFYEGKNYKKMVIIPIILVLISIYFIPKIQLDSTLKGGISIQIITNSTASIQQLTSSINSKIPNAQASVSKSPGGVSVTLAINSSIASAQTDLLTILAAQANYSQATLNLTSYQAELKANPNNSSILLPEIAKAQSIQKKSIGDTNITLAAEISSISPFLNGTPTYNSTNENQMSSVAQSAIQEAQVKYKTQVISSLSEVVPIQSYSYNYVTPTLGAFFLKQIENILITAFVLVAIVAFIVFRTPIPSFAVVFGAVSDIIVALGFMGIFGIPLGIASIGGLLMLVGYSMDTDMLSSIRILKRSEGTPSDRAFSSFKTGITMTATAIISFSILLIISYITFIPTYFEISSVVLFGLLADLLATWFINVPIVLWYKHRKEMHKK